MAAAKAKRKSTSKVIPLPKVNKTQQVPPKLPAAGVVEKSPNKRKQLNRRKSDDQADRYIARKLGHVDETRLKTLRNDEGDSVFQYVKKELKSKRCTQGRLTSAFAVQLFCADIIRDCTTLAEVITKVVIAASPSAPSGDWLPASTPSLLQTRLQGIRQHGRRSWTVT
jgi:hypothetical protein